MSYFDSNNSNNPSFEEPYYRCTICQEFGFDESELGDTENTVCQACHDEIVADEFSNFKKEEGLK